MSGIEIAGLVLGSFPILLNCLDYYREGFEPLEEWWDFRTSFIAFIDDIRHQMMRYNGNMVRLLDPIITDSNSLNFLLMDAYDPRWTDGSLDSLLEHRLAGEHGRFIRVIERMDEIMQSLKKLLQVENFAWIGSEQQRPWKWHLKRFRISFSKNKHKKVRKLAAHNQDLQDMLGYSEQIIPIADARKSSDPVALFEKIRQLACSVHRALENHWKCPNRDRWSHQPLLSPRSETKAVRVNALFVLEDEQRSCSELIREEVEIQLVKEDGKESPLTTTSVGQVQQAMTLMKAQEIFEDMETKRGRPTRGRSATKGTSLISLYPQRYTQMPTKGGKKASIAKSTVETTLDQQNQAQSSPTTTIGSNYISPQIITDICFSLQNCQDSSFGIIVDELNREFRLSRPLKPGPVTNAPDTVQLVPLPELLKAYYEARVDITRRHRFEMAAHITSALLQIQSSPWLATKWSKHNFCFLADSHNLYSDYPYVSPTFISQSRAQPPPKTDLSILPPSFSEEDTRTSLFTVGVILLELIFGHNIEACGFRHLYYGPNNQPNDQTDICTARRWAQKVQGECGPEISDVVRRCLDCSFGPRPSFKDLRFREAVYEGVIKPLTDYLKPWQVAMPQE